ncbi:MAG TPA: hypothetical protein VHI97_06250 [Actinomycetota bacterium]|nr:hypothetical protein [Actinomycetota bacterium]
MARDAALVSTWGSPVAGREAKSLEVFMEFLQTLNKWASEGKCSPPEVFLNVDGSEGMAIIKGKSDALMELLESDENQKLVSKGSMIVEGLKSHLYFSGDEQIQRGTQLYAEAGNELGFM